MTEPLAAFEQNGGDKKHFWDKQSGRGYKSPYEMWKAQEGLPTLRGWGVVDLANGGIPCNMGHVHPGCSQRPA